MATGSMKSGSAGCALGCAGGLAVAAVLTLVVGGVALLLGAGGAGGAFYILTRGEGASEAPTAEEAAAPDVVPEPPEAPAVPTETRTEAAPTTRVATAPTAPSAETKAPPAPTVPDDPPATPSAPEAVAEPVATGEVTVEGPATVVLIDGATRYPLPASVPAGRYTIEATFRGEEPVQVGNARITSGDEVILCNPKMGICRLK